MMHRLVVLVALLAAGCSGREAEHSKSSRELFAEAEAAQERERVASLPADPIVRASLDEAGTYFSEPGMIWARAQYAAKTFNDSGHKASAAEIVQGSAEVMKRLGVVPNSRQRFGEFLAEYKRARVLAASGDSVRPRTHDEAVEILVDRGGFKTK